MNDKIERKQLCQKFPFNNYVKIWYLLYLHDFECFNHCMLMIKTSWKWMFIL